MISIGNKIINTDYVGLTLILFANICLYNEKLVYLFMVVSALGIINVVISMIYAKRYVLYKKSYPIWLSMVYALFVSYQIFALRAGHATWDTLIWRYVENLCIYTVILNALRRGKKYDMPFIVAGLCSIALLIKNELVIILSGQIRIGTSLSGNENTVGFAFGVISVVIMWTYCQEQNRRKIKMGLFAVFTIFMLLTGSKKTLFFLIANVVIYFYFNRGKLIGWIKVLLIICLVLYAIFKIDFFYNILGHRIIDAIETLVYGKNTVNAVYSYSTDVRNDMIFEALQIYKQHPILGGGYNYFLSKTQFPYSYSHCNYTELLCSFGIVGTLLFYSRHIYQLKETVRICFYRKKHSQEIMFLGAIFTLLILFVEIAAVTFSAQSLWYLPITISAACFDYLRESKP